MISAIQNSPFFGQGQGVSQSKSEASQLNTFQTFLDQLSTKDPGVSKEEGSKAVKELLAFIANPPRNEQVAPEPAAEGVFGPNEVS